MQFLLALLSVLFFFQMTSAGGPIGQNFVETYGSYFSLDGYKYVLVGWVTLYASRVSALTHVIDRANAYWISLANLNDADMDKAFADIAGMGATTVRIWLVSTNPPYMIIDALDDILRGHNEMEESRMAPDGIYYQLWRGNKSVINYSPSGFGYFGKSTPSLYLELTG